MRAFADQWRAGVNWPDLKRHELAVLQRQAEQAPEPQNRRPFAVGDALADLVRSDAQRLLFPLSPFITFSRAHLCTDHSTHIDSNLTEAAVT